MKSMDDFMKSFITPILIGLVIYITLLVLIGWYGVTHPAPSKHEICVNNGGTYVENYGGRAGSFCIYDKEGDK